MDNLVAIHENSGQLWQLEGILKKFSACRCILHAWLLMRIRLYLESPTKYPYFIYCPDGEFKNGLILFAETKGIIYHLVVYFFEENHSKMEQALLCTRQIKWKNVKVCGVQPGNVAWFSRILKKLGHKIQVNTQKYICMNMLQDMERVDVTLPDGLYCSPLQESDLPRVLKLASGTFDRFEALIKVCIRFNHSEGVFRKADNSLVCWTLQYDFGQCLIVASKSVTEVTDMVELLNIALVSISKKLKAENKKTILFVNSTNVFTHDIVEKLGYDMISLFNWLTIKPTKSDQKKRRLTLRQIFR